MYKWNLYAVWGVLHCTYRQNTTHNRLYVRQHRADQGRHKTGLATYNLIVQKYKFLSYLILQFTIYNWKVAVITAIWWPPPTSLPHVESQLSCLLHSII